MANKKWVAAIYLGGVAGGISLAMAVQGSPILWCAFTSLSGLLLAAFGIGFSGVLDDVVEDEGNG